MSGVAIAAAAALVWLGMVAAISFLEAPLKFRAPGITTELGLGIGRLVFGALNIAEAVLAVVVALGLLGGVRSAGALWLAAAVVLLAVQLLAVRPMLRRRSARVLAGEGGQVRSRAHWVYVGLEGVKVVCLIAGALLLLGSM
jgi:hypothetical protein